MSIIKARGIHKYYNKGRRAQTHVLDGIDLELPATGLVCLLGESGSGKTTLLNALGRLDNFSAGTEEVGGAALGGRLNRASERARSRLFGYVFQNYFLLDEETVSENLRLALGGSGLTAKEEDARIEYVLRAVDMYAYRKRRADMLSGGQRQRVAIARALVKSPAVIFADEPTGNLDEARTMQVMGILRRVSASCLVLLATHEKELCELFADRIITIRDGRIVGDRAASPDAVYKPADDNALYLSEYEHTRAGEGGVALDYYARANEPIHLTVVHDRGRLYISAPEGLAIETVCPASAVQFKTEPRPVYDRETEVNFAFELPPMEPKGKNAAGMRDKRKRFGHGFFASARKLVIPGLVLVITAALAAAGVSDYLTLSDPDAESFITTDARYLAINVDTTQEALSDINSGAAGGFMYQVESPTPIKRTELVRMLLEEIEANAPAHILWMPHNTELTYSYGGFSQISAQSDKFAAQTVVPLELLDEADLIYGRMPVAPNEIVMDRWILERFMMRDTTLSKSIASVTHFLNQSLDVPKKDYKLVIVGICDSGQPAIYIDRTAGLSFSMAGVLVASLESLRTAYPGLYDDVALAPGECLVSEKRFAIEQDGVYHHQADVDFAIKGTFPDEFPAEFVIAKSDTDALVLGMAQTVRNFSVFAQDKEAFKTWLSEGVPLDLAVQLHITVKDTYAERMEARMATIKTQLRSRMLIIGAAAVMAFAVLYVVMKANARANLRTIAVYRLVGIGRGSIAAMYALQLLLLACATALPAAALTLAVLAVLSQISLLNLHPIISLEATAAAVLVVVALNVLVGLLPIARLLRMPPAKLAAPYDV